MSNRWLSTQLLLSALVALVVGSPLVIQQKQLVRTPRLIADVDFVAAGGSGLAGKVTLDQREGFVIIYGVVKGLKAGKHGFHVHATGLLTDECRDAAGHFNPLGVNHGAPEDAVRHVGDLGNIETPSPRSDQTDGEQLTSITIFDKIISLEPGSGSNVVDRAIVIHGGEDDLGRGGDAGSLATGNAGPRLGCGVIKLR